MAANEGKKATEEDAMFTRKPIGPVSCASCDKGIVNLLGTQADYLAWKKLPFREPNERIAKYGQGFSKILNMMKSSDTQAVNSQTLDVTNGQHHNQTYHDGFNNTRNSPGVNLMSGADIYAHNKNQYPSLPMMSPNKRSGSMDHISADLTEASRSPSKLGGISNGQGRVGIQVPTFQSPKKTARN